MKKVGLLLLLVAVLAGIGLATELYIEGAARDGFDASLSGLELRGEAPVLAVLATLEVTNTTRVDATFVSLDGAISLQGIDQRWSLLEPQRGAALAAGATLPVRIEVRISAGDAVAIGLAALAGGGLDVRFDGDLSVQAFGVWPVGVELHDRRTLRPAL
jgi:hypothetical protein